MPTSENAGGSGPKPFRRPVSGRLLRFRYFQQQVPGPRYVTSFDTGTSLCFRTRSGAYRCCRTDRDGRSIHKPSRPSSGLEVCADGRIPHRAGTRSPFRPAEARNAGVFTLLVEVLDVLAILPLGHPPVKPIRVRPLGAAFDRRLLRVPAPVPHLRRLPLSNLQ